MSHSQGHALASLTATYTDSEGEEDGFENEDETDKSPTSSSHSLSSITPAQSPITVAVVTSKVARLVSYHDDYTVVSDEEGVNHIEEEYEERTIISEDNVMQEADIRDGVQLPPEPPGQCSADLQDKITRLYEKMQTSALDMNHVIQQRKDFRNPSIYEKLIQFCGINEFGTNYPPDVYDPQQWGPESFYEELAKAQKTEMDRREKERKDKTKVEFVSGTARRPGSGSGAEEEMKRRKSKWDQVGTGSATSVAGGSQATTHPPLKPAGLLQQPSLTTSATGTKGTVISAFGSLPKKPRN